MFLVLAVVLLGTVRTKFHNDVISAAAPLIALAAMLLSISAALHPPARSFRPAGAELICGGASRLNITGDDMLRSILPDAFWRRGSETLGLPAAMGKCPSGNKNAVWCSRNCSGKPFGNRNAVRCSRTALGSRSGRRARGLPRLGCAAQVSGVFAVYFRINLCFWF